MPGPTAKLAVGGKQSDRIIPRAAKGAGVVHRVLCGQDIIAAAAKRLLPADDGDLIWGVIDRFRASVIRPARRSTHQRGQQTDAQQRQQHSDIHQQPLAVKRSTPATGGTSA